MPPSDLIGLQALVQYTYIYKNKLINLILKMFVVQYPSSTGQLLSLGLSNLSPSTLGRSQTYLRGLP